MKYPFSLVVLVAFLSLWWLGGVQSLFEDQTGTYDWRQQYVGKPIQTHIDPDGNLVHVATDLHVLAALDANTGKIAWRKLFESGDSGKIVKVFWTSNAIVVVTNEGRKIQSFDYNHGFANWEYLMDQASSNIDIIESTQETDSFYVSHGNQLCIVNSKEKNCVNVPTDGLNHLFETEQGVFLIGVKEAKFHKLHYGSSLNTLISNVASEVNSKLFKNAQCVKSSDSNSLNCFASDSGVIVRLSDVKSGDKLDIVELTASKTVFEASKSKSSPKLIWSSKDMLVVQVELSAHSHDLYLFKREKNENELVLLKRIESASAFEVIKRESNNNFYLVLAKYSNSNKLSFLSFDLKTGQEREDLAFNTQQKEKRTPLLINSRLGDLRNGQLSMNVLAFFEDYSLSMYNSQGTRLFTREEALAYITSAELVQFPLRHLQEEFEDEFGSSNSKSTDQASSLFNMFYKRIRTQLIQLNEFITIDLYERLIHFAKNPSLNSLLNYQPSSDGSTGNPIRDEFNLNQIIVAATSIGRVFGLYTGDQGKVLWSFYLRDIASFKSIVGSDYVGLFLQRTGAHVPYEAQCVLVAKHANQKTRAFFFNPLNGKAIKDQPIDGHVFDFELKQAFLSNFHDTQYLKPLLLFDTQKRLHVLPEKSTGEVLSKMGSKLNIIYSADKNEKEISTLTGYAVTAQLDKPLPEVWRISFEDESIVAVAAKLPSDRIHSQGKVLGDRSVLYKYLNPNLIGVVTSGIEGQKVPIVNIYLIDTITGSIVYSYSHKKCRGPVSIIHSENWFFYSYYNIKNRRNEVTSVELFEGSVQSNSTHFSSLDDVKPINFTKSFIANRGFDAMQLTITEKGISNKDVIVAGQFGLIIEIPSIFFDARRPLIMTEVHREENLLPYMPEIPLNYEFSLNYYNHVYNVRGITTAPSGLESTSLVFVYGLDLFFTRAFPSKTFDMLREDFDYLFITTLMVGLLAGTFLSKKLAQSSNLKKAWK